MIEEKEEEKGRISWNTNEMPMAPSSARNLNLACRVPTCTIRTATHRNPEASLSGPRRPIQHQPQLLRKTKFPACREQISTRRPIRCSGSHFNFLAASTMPAASEPRQDMADRPLVMRALSPYITSAPHHVLHQKKKNPSIRHR